MSVQAISAILAGTPTDASAAIQTPTPLPMPAPVAANGVDGATHFGALVSNGLEQVNGDLIAAQADMQKLAAGNAPDLHRIMINLEQTQLSFQLMMQVRSRLMDAYQDVMKMQV